MQTFLRVSIPNLKAAILGSALLVFTLSFDEVAITFLLTATENTLPMQIWAMRRRGEASLCNLEKSSETGKSAPRQLMSKKSILRGVAHFVARSVEPGKRQFATGS